VKNGIHPELRLAAITCAACGTSFVTHSTAGDLTVERCSECHPAYTGREAVVSSGSRIERFERRFARAGRTRPD
jgi:large subunit ribosomal protein L31